ncbi:MAG: hypothetical protein H0X25_00205 [Acidobacteriales bacterium]|nr:hypothetical protein [Terriglobales bacterium]
MRKTKLAVVHKTSNKRKASGGTGRAVDLSQVRQRIANLIGSRAVDMVKASADDAQRKGNVAAMKFLFEAVGLFPAPAEVQTDQKPGLAETLLARLDGKIEE